MTPPPRNRDVQSGLLALNIREKSALYAAYMPYVKNGGLFVATDREFHLGDEVFLLLTLMDDGERCSVGGKIVWITPRGAQNKRAQGVGVQFQPPDGPAVQKKIETLLAGLLNDERPTSTL